MTYSAHVMTQEEAEQIANWHYEGAYAFYDMEADEEDLTSFLDPQQRGEHCFTVVLDGEIVGFLAYAEHTAGVVDIGLGMEPSRTGKGMGLSFVQYGLHLAEALYDANVVTLAVALFNVRAIKVYERAGFVRGETYTQAANGSAHPFLRMCCDLHSGGQQL